MSESTGASLRYDGGELKLPRIEAVEGNAGYDVSKLLKHTGAVTFDPGFMNTAATTSAITYIDGDQGILRYRGYPIVELAQHSNFLEVSYLLIYGNLLPLWANDDYFPMAFSRKSVDANAAHRLTLRPQ